MNELVWEGLIEILRGNQPSLKASARLWRRDDVFGADWGGQLELPVVFRRLLPPGEYAVRLPSGSEAAARITSGPSTTSMTFPTLTGVGQPPFGAPEGHSAVTEVEALIEAPAVDETPTLEVGAPETPEVMASAPLEAVPEVVMVATPEETPKRARPATATAAAPEQAAAVAPANAPAVLAAPVSPRPQLRLVEADSSPEPVIATSGEGLGQTEAMARAFLASVEARQRLLAISRPGFEGRAIEAARQDIEAATATLEGALRARAGTDRWPQELNEHLSALSWFASLAVPDEQLEVASAGRAVQALVATVEALLVPASIARAA